MRSVGSAMLLAMLLLPFAGAAQSLTGNPLRGQQLAREVCVTCHAVNAGEYGFSPVGAPAFQDLADNPEINELSLRVLLQMPHRDMPDLVFDADEMDDIIAYIASLK